MNSVFNLPSISAAPGSCPERLLTIREAAMILGRPYWQIQRATKRGDIPSYQPFNSRKLVKLSEIVEFIEASRCGGAS